MLNQIFVKSLSRFLPRMVLYEPESGILSIELRVRLKLGRAKVQNILSFS